MQQQITGRHNISQRFTPSLKQPKNCSFLFSVKTIESLPQMSSTEFDKSNEKIVQHILPNKIIL